MIQELFKLIIQKLKIVSSGINRLFAPESVLGRIKIAMKKALDKIFHIKPRDKNDYYNIGRWMISKRLISMIIFVIGIIGIYYLVIVQAPFMHRGSNGVKIYDYDSVRLRFANDTVKIRTKSGYIGYYGEVSKGKANGKGILYSDKSVVRYEGQFKNSEYSGNGNLYRDNGNLLYTGEFEHNKYKGNGVLYRDNGSEEYEGEFADGEKSGNGKLFDSSNNQVYEGSFQNDEVNYSELLGKSTAEVSEIYTGKRIIYYKENEFMVGMTDIDSYYAGDSDESYLDDKVMINQIYVNKNYCIIKGKKIHSIEELKELLGNPGYTGKSIINLREAVVLEKLTDVNADFEDAIEVKDYEKEIELYLTVFEYEDMQYTFYSTDISNEFIMYSIEK